MIARIRHQFTLAAPILGFGLLVSMVFFTAQTLADVAMVRPATAMEFRLGEGIDVASQYLQLAALSLPHPTGIWETLPLIAMTVTAISLIAVTIYIIRMIGGFGDMGRFVSHLFNRVRLVSWSHQDHVWGIVKDSETGHSLPFAGVHLVGSDRAVLATSITNARGEYRFRPMLAGGFSTGYALEAAKDGYYFPSKTPRSSQGLDIHMDPRKASSGQGRASSRALQVFGTTAFWASVVTVPLVVTVSSGPLAVVLAMGLGVSIVVRIGVRC